MTARCDGRWLNLDRNALPHWPAQPDVLTDATCLPLRTASCEAAYLGHYCEHLTYNDALPRSLAEVVRVLLPGAAVAVVGPCIRKGVETGQPDWLLDAIVSGEQTGDGLNHAWLPTTSRTLAALMACPGLTDVREVPVASIAPPQWPNASPDANWQCAFTATRV